MNPQCIYSMCVCIYIDVDNWLRIPHVVLSRQNLISFLWEAHSIGRPIPAYLNPQPLPSPPWCPTTASCLSVALYWTVTHSKLLLLTLESNNSIDKNSNSNKQLKTENCCCFYSKGFSQNSRICVLWSLVWHLMFALHVCVSICVCQYMRVCVCRLKGSARSCTVQFAKVREISSK